MHHLDLAVCELLSAAEQVRHDLTKTTNVHADTNGISAGRKDLENFLVLQSEAK